MIRRLVPVVAALGLVAVACGGGQSAPPMHPDTAEADAGATSDPSPPPTEDAGAATATAPTTPPASDADASAASPKPSSDIIANKTDECTPVGMDLEKRARPKINDCYQAGKKNDKDLKGKVEIAIDIDAKGKVRSVKIKESTFPDAVAQCMLKAVKGTPFPEATKCPGHGITIPVIRPTPR